MEFLTDLIGGFASGGIFGTVLSLASAGVKIWADSKKRKQEHQFRMDEWAKEKELRALEIDAGRAETENELAISRADASVKGMTAAYNDQIAAGQAVTGPWGEFANVVRTLFRPVLTTILIGCFIWVLTDLLDILRGSDAALIAAFTPAAAGELVTYMIYTLAFSTSTAVLWWYGERAFLPKHLK